MKKVVVRCEANHPVTIRFTDAGTPICPVCGTRALGSDVGTYEFQEHFWAGKGPEGDWHGFAFADLSCLCCGYDPLCDSCAYYPEQDWNYYRVRWLDSNNWDVEKLRQIEEVLELTERELREQQREFHEQQREQEKLAAEALRENRDLNKFN